MKILDACLPLTIDRQPSNHFPRPNSKPCTHFSQRPKDQPHTKNNKMKLEVEKIAVRFHEDQWGSQTNLSQSALSSSKFQDQPRLVGIISPQWVSSPDNFRIRHSHIQTYFRHRKSKNSIQDILWTKKSPVQWEGDMDKGMCIKVMNKPQGKRQPKPPPRKTILTSQPATQEKNPLKIL